MTRPTALTDSQIAAHAAAQALNERRYALAEAFARIARVALAHEQAAENAAAIAAHEQLVAGVAAADAGRFDAEIRAEQEMLDAAAAAELRQQNEQQQQQRTNSFAAQLDADATGVMPAVVIPQAPARLTDQEAWERAQNQPTATARCRQEKADPSTDGAISRHFCDLAIYLGPDKVWRHVHLSLDHPAVPPPHWGAKPQYRNAAADMSRGER